MSSKPLFTNNAATALAVAIIPTDTVLQIVAGTGNYFPQPTGTDYFMLTLVQINNPEVAEIVKCTARTGDYLTVVRGQEGTQPQIFNISDNVQLRITAQSLNLFASESHAEEDLAAYEALIASSAGSSLVGYTQGNSGTVSRTVQSKLQESISVKDFGALGDGTTDDTAAFQAAQTYAASIGGSIITIPSGTYVLTNFDIINNNIIFEGETSGYGYTNVTTNVTLIPSATATYVARLKGVAGSYVINASAQSGFKNVVFNCPTAGSCLYGLFIDSGNTILEQVTIQYFQYGCVLAAGGNANRFTNCAFVLNTKVGFGATEAVFSGTLYPTVAGISTTTENTAFTMTGCIFRQNDFGMVLRQAENCLFSGCVFESNNQAGLYIYRPDNANVFGMNFQSCWFENNYSAYTSGSTSYSITGNAMFLITNSSTYIAWTSLNQAGYQLLIDSQTHAGGGSWAHEFNMCTLGCDNTAQKDIFILAAFDCAFRRCEFIGSGDTPNLIKCSNTATAIHFYDPVAGNNPAAFVTSLTDNYGANTGSKGAYIYSGQSSTQLGGLYPAVGVFGGPIQFPNPPLASADLRTQDPFTLSTYQVGTSSTTPVWGSTGSTTPFTVNSQTNSYTKIGRLVHVEYSGTLTVAAAVSGNSNFYMSPGLPFPANASGFVIAQLVLTPTGGGASVNNNGFAPMVDNNPSSLTSALPVLPTLSIGNTYSFTVVATYNATY